jgi:hypothetical protein
VPDPPTGVSDHRGFHTYSPVGRVWDATDRVNTEISKYLSSTLVNRRLTTFICAAAFGSMYLCVVRRFAWPANIWTSRSDPSTVDILGAVFVMNVRLPLWLEQPLNPSSWSRRIRERGVDPGAAPTSEQRCNYAASSRTFPIASIQ